MTRTPRVGVAPEDDGSVLVLWVAENLMQQDGKSVEVANVQWTKVGVEGVVEQMLVNRKVDGSKTCGRGGSGSLLRSRSLRRGPTALLCRRVRKRRVRVGRVRVRSQVQAV